ncbi:MAG: GAF domain-containing protein [Chloroflexi bacterium]|nr:GAF domain-containing protein [Chloroflexota bacterium]
MLNWLKEKMRVRNDAQRRRAGGIHGNTWDIVDREWDEAKLRARERYLVLLKTAISDVLDPAQSEDRYYRLIDCFVNLLVADYGFFFHWDEGRKQAALAASTRILDRPVSEIVLRAEQSSLAAAILQSEQMLALDGLLNPNDAAYATLLGGLAQPVKSAIHVPLIAQGYKLGIVVLAFNASRPFGPDELLQLREAADQIALALRVTHQETEIQKRLLEVNTLAQIGNALSESERVGLQSVLQLIVESARELIPPIEQAVIHLFDNEEQVLIPEALIGYENSEEGKRKMRIGEGVAGQALETKQLIHIPDVNSDPRFIRLNPNSKIRSLIVLPIISGAERLGALSIQSGIPNAFTGEHNRLLSALGAQAAIAIENAHLIENTKQALKEAHALYRVAQGVAASLDPDEVMKDTVDLLQKNFGYHYTQVFVADPDTGNFIMRAGSGPIGATLKEQGYSLLPGEGIVGYTAETGTAFFTNNVNEILSYERHPLLPDTKSELAMPVRIGDEVLGLLDIHQAPPKRLTQRDVQLVSAAADQLAIALQKAALYEDLQIALQQEKAIRNQMVQNERLAVMGRLLASVSHELNNPLQAIQNALFLLKEEKGISQQGRQDLDIVLAESERMAGMIGRLRDTYRPTQAHEFHPTQINDLIMDVHALIATHLRHNQIAFEFHPDETLPAIPALSDQLRQVVLNLMVNAMEAMPNGGILRAFTQYIPESGEVTLTMSDTGTGIHETVLPHIFDAFVTDKEKGTGLGLTITYDIVAKHRGRIVAANNDDGGATFRVWLPLENRELL